jgi:hypothetical protein
MKVRVMYLVNYETDDFEDELQEYEDDHTLTTEMIKQFCIDRAFNLTAVDPAGDIIVTHIPVHYQVM